MALSTNRVASKRVQTAGLSAGCHCHTPPQSAKQQRRLASTAFCSRHGTDSAAQTNDAVSRRLIVTSSVAATLQAIPCKATAADSGTLPRAYQEIVRKLSLSLRESIEAEQAGEKEYEVRRKADPAKEALQTFVKRWRDDPRVMGHPSHSQVLAILSELGTFYQRQGPRAKMPAALQARLLGFVQAAEATLKMPGDQNDEDKFARSLLP